MVRAEDRLSFLYLERCTVHRDQNALTAQDEHGITHIPAATLSTVLFGPGTRVTHQAMMLLADSASTAVWVGESGVRYYAHGRGLSSSSRMLEAQARLVTNQSGEDVSGMTMQQLRGREGARVRKAYRQCAEDFGVEWNRRDYDVSDFEGGDTLNKALSAATSCLYGMVHGVVVALGCSPMLGFIHTGHSRSFVFDIADLYKVEVAVPVAFRAAAEHDEGGDIGASTRHRMRDALYDGKLMARSVRDTRVLILGGDHQEPEFDVVRLWDGGTAELPGGVSYPLDDPGW